MSLTIKNKKNCVVKNVFTIIVFRKLEKLYEKSILQPFCSNRHGGHEHKRISSN